ncbi:MAG: SAM-dependent chlorinase/fluorinase [Desulfobacterales bacterium]
MNIITLLTDFGNSDEYVGVMKGVIYSINPGARIVDLTHGIDPQDITQAAYLIKASYSYFPKSTIHLTVVDPGVGTERKIAVIQIDNHIFVAPDNGVLSLLWQDHEIESGVWVNDSRYFLSDVSRTFHGRDIFAPLTAWISKKMPLKKLGPEITVSDLQTITTLPARISAQNSIQGKVVSVDRFGNLLTNVEAKTIFQFCHKNSDKLPVIKLGEIYITGLSSSYQDVPKKSGLMIIGSRNLLEIAVNCGNASRMFNVRKNDSIVLTLKNFQED